MIFNSYCDYAFLRIFRYIFAKIRSLMSRTWAWDAFFFYTVYYTFQ